MGLMAGLMAGFMGGQFAIDHGGACTFIVARDNADRMIVSRRIVAPLGLNGVPGGFGHS
jgi:hypothetical protein